MTHSRVLNILIICLVFLHSGARAQSDAITESKPFKIIAFDAFPIFDPRPIVASIESAFPGQGITIWNAWRTRLFEYQWLRALGGQYENFMHAANASLEFVAMDIQLNLDPDIRNEILNEFMNLKPWPDAAESISQLRSQGVKLVFLSNMTEQMLLRGLEDSILQDHFDAILSTDSASTYKPAADAYSIVLDRYDVSREEVLFVAFAGWDVAGAKWFGYPTFWVNRAGATLEQLGEIPDGQSQGLAGLVQFVREHQSGF